MKQSALYSLATLAAVASALPFTRREVPLEHSHEETVRICNTFLKLDNPNEIQDCVFGLLGNAAGSKGQGKITDTDCLQQATADQAFSNAKAKGDIDGMVGALTYRCLERNTGQVGLKSVLCTSIKAVNPEIAALTQHQDPASENAAEINKGIALELAKQIAAVGGDPNLAIRSGTFAPGKIGDPTAAGNTCDDPNDPVGCIFTLNRLVPDVTEEEIAAAVAGIGNGNNDNGNGNGNDNNVQENNNVCPVVNNDDNEGDDNENDNQNENENQNQNQNENENQGGNGNGNGNAGAEFGKCGNVGIEFGIGFDGRKDPSFQPIDKGTFNHGSALNIKVITGFIISRLQDFGGCGSNAAAVALAQSAETAALALTGQAAADAWNNAFGV